MPEPPEGLGRDLEVKEKPEVLEEGFEEEEEGSGLEEEPEDPEEPLEPVEEEGGCLFLG